MKIGLKIDGSKALRNLAKDISRFPEQAAAAGMAAANDVAELVMTAAPRDITQRLNLPPTYIREKFVLYKAKRAIDPAVVAARKRPTRLARFAVQQLTTDVKHPARSKGDVLRGIPAGKKAAGVSVKVLRSGQRKRMPGSFLLPLRAGKIDGGNGMGLFWRWRKEIEHEYGPSPDQEFNYWIGKNQAKIDALLIQAYRSRFAREMKRK